AGVVLCGFPRRKENPHSWFSQEALEANLVLVLPGAAVKSGFDLRYDDQGDPNFLAFAQPVSQFRIALKEIREPIGVQRDPHFSTASLPLFPIDLALGSNNLVERRIRSPLAHQIRKIRSAWTSKGRACQFVDHDLIEAELEFRRLFSERAIHFRGNAANGILGGLFCLHLHAYMIAFSAGTYGDDSDSCHRRRG